MAKIMQALPSLITRLMGFDNAAFMWANYLLMTQQSGCTPTATLSAHQLGRVV